MSIITLNTRSLPDSAVTTAKIAADAVTDAKIADDVVGTEHLTAGEVDATALGADSVTAAKINDDIISGSTELASGVASTDELLISDAGTIKRVDVSLIKGLDGVTTGSGNVTITDGNLIVADGHGIDFSATGDASGSSAELLDDYEEGTWTAGIDSGTFSFSKNTGYYRKVGNLVYVHLYIVTNGYTSGSRINVTGLPFTSKNISSYDGHYPISCTRFTGVHENVLAVYPMVNPGGTTIKTDTTNSAGSTCTSNNVEFFGAATHARFGGCYITD